MKESVELCTKVLLHPFEGYHRKLPNGDCESYPDPASPLARGVYSKDQVAASHHFSAGMFLLISAPSANDRSFWAAS